MKLPAPIRGGAPGTDAAPEAAELLDSFEERERLENTQSALLNILEDLAAEKDGLQQGQQSLFNILEDATTERLRLAAAERAVLNILEDSFQDKIHLEDTKRALLNILEDITSVEAINQRVVEERKRADAISMQLRASNKELEAFSYSVSHDLRAPLRHIAGFTKLLVEEHGAQLPAEAQRYLNLIRDSTRQMGQLVDDLLNYARLGRQDLQPRETDLKSLVEEVIAGFAQDTQQRSIEWKIAALPFLECDPPLMKVAFNNLLSNALKFTQARERAVIEVGVADTRSPTAIYVRDNGVGFNMKYVDKLFGVFQRLHRAEDFEGTGVGLATVQRIIQKHGGSVWAEAEVGQGATFYFTLSDANRRGT